MASARVACGGFVRVTRIASSATSFHSVTTSARLALLASQASSTSAASNIFFIAVDPPRAASAPSDPLQESKDVR
jgi:hypothetical protein